MSERYPNDTDADPKTGKQVGEFDYDDGNVEPVLERQPYWVRIGQGKDVIEGWMDPDHDGSFELNPTDPNDETSVSKRDIGPKNAAATPDEIPMEVFNPPGDVDENGNDIELTEEQQNPDNWWDPAIYRPKRF